MVFWSCGGLGAGLQVSLRRRLGECAAVLGLVRARVQHGESASRVGAPVGAGAAVLAGNADVRVVIGGARRGVVGADVGRVVPAWVVCVVYGVGSVGEVVTQNS